MGKVIATVGTVFMYRINVAVSSILIFMNMQILISAIFREEGTAHHVWVASGLLLLSMLYAVWAFNGMTKKFIIYDDGAEYRSLLKRLWIPSGDVEMVTFARKDSVRMRIDLFFKGGKKITINAASYKDNQPLIDFCARFERG